jgi:hypothetical protein
VHEAGGSPYLIQLMGEESWMQARPEAGTSIRLQHVEAAAVEVRENLDNGMFRGRWAKATPVEKAVIVAIADTAGTDGVANDWGHLDGLGRAGSAVEDGAPVADRQRHDRARRPRPAQVHDAGVRSVRGEGRRRGRGRPRPRGDLPCASAARPGPQR